MALPVGLDVPARQSKVKPGLWGMIYYNIFLILLGKLPNSGKAGQYSMG